MTEEAAEVYAAATASMGTIMSGLLEWASTMLDGAERKEIIFHVEDMEKSFHRFTLAVKDHNGGLEE